MENLIFRTVVETGDSIKKVDELNGKLDETGKNVDDVGQKGRAAFDALNAKVESGTLTMRQSAKAVKEYQTIALQAGRTSPIGREAIERAGELTDALGDLREEIVNAGADGANMQAGLQLASGIAAGYGALQGAMALAGGESEALQQTFVKLQAVQSILVGIETIRGSLEREQILMQKARAIGNKILAVSEVIYAAAVGGTTGAMKALRIAMLAIPIVAIVAAIVALVAVLASFFSATEVAEEQNKALTASFEKQDAAMAKNDRAFARNSENKIALARAQGASLEELHAMELAQMEGLENIRKKGLITDKDRIEKKRAVYKQALAEDNDELATSIKEEIKALKSKYSASKELDGQYFEDKKLKNVLFANGEAERAAEAAKKSEQKTSEWRKKASEREAEQNASKLEAQRLLEDLLVANIEDENLRKIAQLKLQNERELAEVVKKYGAASQVAKELTVKQANETKALAEELAREAATAKTDAETKERDEARAAAELLNRDKKARLEGALIEMKANATIVAATRLELILLERDEALLQEGITEGEKYKIAQEYAQKKADLIKQNAEEEKAQAKSVQLATRQVSEQGIAAAMALSDAFFSAKLAKVKKGGAEELALEKQKFEINKKLQIAQAIIQGIQGVQAAYASGVSIPVVGAVTGPLFAAAAGATAALNISKIKSTTFGATSAASASSAPTVQVPTVATPGGASDGGGAGSSTLTSGLARTETQTIKVAVLDSDIKLALSKSAAAEVISGIGG
jgi:hypothetical protein